MKETSPKSKLSYKIIWLRTRMKLLGKKQFVCYGNIMVKYKSIDCSHRHRFKAIRKATNARPATVNRTIKAKYSLGYWHIDCNLI